MMPAILGMTVNRVANEGRRLRALFAAGAMALATGPAFAAAANPTGSLDPNSYATAADFDAIEQNGQFAGSYDFTPVTMDGFTAVTPDARTPRVTLVDGVTLGFGAGESLASRFNAYDATGKVFDGLFLDAAAVRGSYAALASGGTYVDASVDLSPSLHLALGAQSVSQGKGFYFSPALSVDQLGGIGVAEDWRDANTLLAGISWDVSPWAGIGFSASQTSENNGVLGNFDPAVRSADTSALGVSARIRLGGGWTTTASFAQANTKLDLKPGLAAAWTDDWRSRSYGIAVAKNGVFGNDTMGLAVTRPAPGMGGSGFDLISGSGASAQPLPESLLLDGQSSETDFEVGYLTTFLDGSVALQANAAYQMNFAGQTGNNAVSFLSRAKIKF